MIQKECLCFVFLVFVALSVPAYAFGPPEDMRLAAEQGDAEAQTGMGMYYFGSDYEKSTMWFEKAAEKGEGFAQVMLGKTLHYGLGGMRQDPERARVLYEKAAEQDIPCASSALFHLGSMYENGDGVAKDPEKSIMWYRRAVVKGHEYAAEAIAAMYRDGIGVDVDYPRAWAWFEVSRKMGNEKAGPDTNALKENMSEESKKEAEKIFEEIKADILSERKRTTP